MKKLIPCSLLLLLLSCAGSNKTNPIYTGDFKCGSYKVTLFYGSASTEISEYPVRVVGGNRTIPMKLRTTAYGYKDPAAKKGYLSARTYFSDDDKSSFNNSVLFAGNNPHGRVEKNSATLRIGSKTIDCERIDLASQK